MVITNVWMESWTAVIISLGVLTVIGAVLMCCICWETKKKSMNHFYILDENGLTKVTTTSEVCNNNAFEVEGTSNNQRARNLFRHLPSRDSFQNNFTTKMLSTSGSEKRKWSSERDLIQSMEITDSFEKSILRLEDNNLASIGGCLDKEDDLKSCVSDDSKHTFYSTYRARSTSAAGTICSTMSQSDLYSCTD